MTSELQSEVSEQVQNSRYKGLNGQSGIQVSRILTPCGEERPDRRQGTGGFGLGQRQRQRQRHAPNGTTLL